MLYEQAMRQLDMNKWSQTAPAGQMRKNEGSVSIFLGQSQHNVMSYVCFFSIFFFF